MDRRSLREGRNLENTDDTPYGPIVCPLNVRGLDGSAMQISIAHPYAFMRTVANLFSSFNAFWKSRLDEFVSSPEKPWRLIVYTDEITPGNALSCSNVRKCLCIYYSFLEFGISALSSEHAWFTMMCEYSHVIAKVSAGHIMLPYLFHS